MSFIKRDIDLKKINWYIKSRQKKQEWKWPHTQKKNPNSKLSVLDWQILCCAEKLYVGNGDIKLKKQTGQELF